MNLLQDFLTLWKKKQKITSSQIIGTDYIAVFRSRKRPHVSSIGTGDPSSVMKIVPASQFLAGIDDLCDVPLTGIPIDCTGPQNDGDVMFWNETANQWQFGPAGTEAPKEVIVLDAVKTLINTKEPIIPSDAAILPDPSTAYFGGYFYEGTSTLGNITEYTAEVIYKVRFLSTNDWGPDPININWITALRIDQATCTTGCGRQAVQRGTMSGWENLAVSSIIPDVYYYLAWDGQRFQLYTENPDNTNPSTFQNANPTTTDVGGIPAGSTFPNPQTMQNMWNLLLYPYQQPSFSDFSVFIAGTSTNLGAQPFECGYEILSRGGLDFTWTSLLIGNMVQGSGYINDLTQASTLVGNVDISQNTSALNVPGPNDFTSLIPNTTYDFSINGENTNGGVIPTATTEVLFLLKKFWGKSDSCAPPALNPESPESVKVFAEFQQEMISFGGEELSKTADGEYIFADSGNTPKYLYFMLPVYIDGPDLITSMDIEMVMAADDSCGTEFPNFNFSEEGKPYKFSVRELTNQYGVSETYRIYRSHNKFAGEVNIKINLH
jgi:hypothetical protein